MKTVPLSQGKVAIVDDEDFLRVSQYIWYAIRDRNTYYAARKLECLDGKRHFGTMHRFILGIGFGDTRQVDHKNGDGLDNRRDNLRIATVSQNASNSRRIHGKVPFKGVTGRSKTQGFQVRISVKSVRVHVGTFRTPEAAARAYDEAVTGYHGEFAVTNKSLGLL